MTPRQAEDSIARGDWQALKAAISDMTPEGAYELLKLTAHGLRKAINLDAAVRAPDDLVGHIVQGGMAYFLSGRARGGALPNAMSETQTFDYISGLAMANDAIRRALRIDADSGLANAFFTGCAIDEFEEGQKDEAASLIAQAQGVPVSGYLNLVAARSEKWGGSHDDMFRAARSYFDPSRPGTAALIAKAHFERRLYYTAFDTSPDARHNYRTYFSPDVMDELNAASAAVLKAGSGDPAELRLANNWLALVFAWGNKNNAAVKHLDRIKGGEDPTIWSIMNNPGALKRRARGSWWPF